MSISSITAFTSFIVMISVFIIRLFIKRSDDECFRQYCDLKYIKVRQLYRKEFWQANPQRRRRDILSFTAHFITVIFFIGAVVVVVWLSNNEAVNTQTNRYSLLVEKYLAGESLRGEEVKLFRVICEKSWYHDGIAERLELGYSGEELGNKLAMCELKYIQIIPYPEITQTTQTWNGERYVPSKE